MSILAAIPALDHPLWMWLVHIVGTISVLIVLAIVWFYRRTRADEVLVRTGWRGIKIIIDGGIIAFPIIHELKHLSLQTMPLTVKCSDKDSLITKDHYRIDLTANFYVKVEKRHEDIEKALRSIGDKELNVDSIMALVQDKLIWALRSVAASKELQVLHENRQGFAEAVDRNLRSDLAKNGLTLESISVTHFDQTPKTAYKEDNVFDARGLKGITEITERARKEKSDIIKNTEIAIAQKEVATEIEKTRIKTEGERQRLELEKECEFAVADQTKAVEKYRAEREAEKKQFWLQQEEEAGKLAILKDQEIKEADIASQIYLIDKEREKETVRLAKERDIELANRDKEIAIIHKQKELEAAMAEHENARQALITVEKINNIEGYASSSSNQFDEGNRAVLDFFHTGAAMPMFKEMLKFTDIDGENLTLAEIAQKAVQSIPGASAQ